MEIKAIRMFDGGFMNQQFAFGGEGSTGGGRSASGGRTFGGRR